MLKIHTISIQTRYTAEVDIPDTDFVQLENMFYAECEQEFKRISHRIFYNNVAEPEFYLERGTTGGLVICKQKCTHTLFGEFLDRIGLKKYYFWMMETLFG